MEPNLPADEALTAIRDITMALALAQEFREHDKTPSQQPLDMILAKRTAGEGWGKIAHDLNPKLGPVRSEVEKAEISGDPPQESFGRNLEQSGGAPILDGQCGEGWWKTTRCASRACQATRHRG